MRKPLDAPLILVATATAALFAAALFVKGITHDLFLEAGILLLSIKVLMMMRKTHQDAEHLDHKLDSILDRLDRLSAPKPPSKDKTPPPPTITSDPPKTGI